MKYPSYDKNTRPKFEYLVKSSNSFDYYLFDNFNDAMERARVMSLFKDSRIVFIYEPYFDTNRREWYGIKQFEAHEGKYKYDKYDTKVELHLDFYLNAGEWLNPRKDWQE